MKIRQMIKSNQDNWEEIVFENRNRAYGAYLLRHNYPVYLSVSALSVILLFLIIVIGLNIKKEKKAQAYNLKYVQITDYNELSAPPPVKKKYVPPKKAAVKPPEVKKYIPPIVTPEKIIEPEEFVTVEKIKEITPIVESVEETESTESEGVEDGPPAPFFDINPSFRGGGITFEDWLAQNLRYPVAAKRMGIEGTVIVEFTVDEHGNVSEATILESLHRLCDREALRLVKIMPPWAPGIRNGRRTGGRHVVEIPFILK